MMMAHDAKSHEFPAKRKRASVYVDDGFDADDKPPSQESLSAFGLKLIDSRRSLAELYGITPSSQSSPSNLSYHSQSDPTISRRPRPKRPKSSHIMTLGDLNSAVNVDTLLKRREDSSSDRGTNEGQVSLSRKSSNTAIQDGSSATFRRPEIESSADLHAIHSSTVKAPVISDQRIQQRQDAPRFGSAVKDGAEPKPVANAPSSNIPMRIPRVPKKAFFNNPLPSRIPKRPRPEQFEKSKRPPKPPRVFALRQVNAVNSRAKTSWPDTSKQVPIDVPVPDSSANAIVNENQTEGGISSKSSDHAIICELSLQHSGYLERNTNTGLPRNPESAVQLLPGLPSIRRAVFLEHIFSFFNHNHLTMLIRLQNGQFIKYLEKWIVDGVQSSDTTLLRTLLLLLEVLPVTPSFHCRGLTKILQTCNTTDTVVKNLFCRINEKWQFLEQTIRNHKAHKEECKRAISFCDETETIEYSIFLPPDTIRKTRKDAVKGALKQPVRLSATNGAPPRSISSQLAKDHPSKPIALTTENSDRNVSPSGMAPIENVRSDSQQGNAIPVRQRNSVGSAHSEHVSKSQVDECSGGFKRYDPHGSVGFDTGTTVDAHTAPEISATAVNADVLQDLNHSKADFQLSQLPAQSAIETEPGATTRSSDLPFLPPEPHVAKAVPSSSQFALNSVVEKFGSSQFLKDIPLQPDSENETSGDSVNALLLLVPNIVKDFSSSLLSSKVHLSTPILPNPFLSSSKASQSRLPSESPVSSSNDPEDIILRAV